MKTFWIASFVAAAVLLGSWGLIAARRAPTSAQPRLLAAPATEALAPKAHGRPPPDTAACPPETVAQTATPDAATMALAAAVDLLTSAQSSFAQKQALWDQLRKAGRLDDVIGALKQLATDSPNDASVAIALGEAEISQQREVFEHGGDFNQLALLALQADQNFSAALAQDPTNWEAQFDKASALSHWPAAMNKGPEVIQELSALVTQQEATAPRPEFAQTYALLGEQYQAAGQPDKAAQTWQQGSALFPFNSALQQDLTHVAAR
jgi:tetratricopeptide (TPR) repeat protein